MSSMNNAGSITPPKFSSVNLNVCSINIYSYFVQGPTKYNGHIPRSWNHPTWLNNVTIGPHNTKEVGDGHKGG